MKRIVIEYKDFVIKANAKSNLFSLYRKTERTKRSSDEKYGALIDIKLSTTIDKCVENIIFILINENSDTMKLGNFLDNLKKELSEIKEYFDNLINTIYNYKNINTYYFSTELELISFKSYLGKKIVSNSIVLYEGLESEITDNINCHNKTFLRKEEIYMVDRYILICQLKQ